MNLNKMIARQPNVTTNPISPCLNCAAMSKTTLFPGPNSGVYSRAKIKGTTMSATFENASQKFALSGVPQSSISSDRK
jgi:hypothetical protein